MNNKTNSNRANNPVTSTDNHDAPIISGNQAMKEIFLNQFTRIALDMNRTIISRVIDNGGDYKKIDEDNKLSPTEKALAKRVVLAADVGIGLLGCLATLVLVYGSNKVLRV